MNEINIKRANMIDGLPSSFDVTHPIKSGKKCKICENAVTDDEIKINSIAYTDEFEFTHKKCLANNDIFYEHLRPKDQSSPIKLIEFKNPKNFNCKTG
jgi:hypothetical protein